MLNSDAILHNFIYMYTNLLCVLLICSCEHVSASAYFHVCHKSDPNISMCIKNTIEELRPRLITGKTDMRTLYAYCMTVADDHECVLEAGSISHTVLG